MSGIKIIKFDLPINGIKAKSLDELRDNLSDELVALARSGQLGRWLASRKHEEIAQAVAAAVVAESDDKALFLALCRALGVEVHPDDVAALFDAAPQAGRRLVIGSDEGQEPVSRDAIQKIFHELIPYFLSGSIDYWSKSINVEDRIVLAKTLARIDSRPVLREVFEDFFKNMFREEFSWDSSLCSIFSKFDFYVNGVEVNYFHDAKNFRWSPNVVAKEGDFLSEGDLIASVGNQKLLSYVSGKVKFIRQNGCDVMILMEVDPVDS